MPREKKPIVLEGVRLIFKNFKGKETQYNAEGDRNFGVCIDDDRLVKKLQREGWNVKFLRAAEEGGEQQAWLPVTVSFKNRPPQIYIMPEHNIRRRTQLKEDTVDVLDFADIVGVDLMVSPYEWEVGSARGTKAYLQSMYVTIEEDPLSRKYGEMDVDDLPTRSGRTINE